MKRGARMRSVVLLGLVALAAHSASAGSAVAWDGHGHLVSYHGYPVEEAKRLALETARGRYGTSVRILAASDVTGYGAIALAHKGTGSIVGVALGRASAREAEELAIEQCVILGGTEPRVQWRFKG